MKDGPSIFRKRAIQSLSSPEKLDELITITEPRLWFALAGILLLIGLVLVWSVFGRIPTTVDGQGILLKSAGLFKITARGSAQIEEMKVGAGDTVKKGQVVAVLGQKSLEKEIGRVTSHLGEIEAQHERLTSFEQKGSDLELDIKAQSGRNIEKRIADLAQEESWLKDKLATQEELLTKGVITTQVVVDTRQALAETQQKINTARTELVQLDLEKTKVRNAAQQAIFNSRIRINETRHRLEKLKGDLASRSVIKSPKAGRVLEVFVGNGTVIDTGTSVLSIELGGIGLEAIVYIPPEDGKKVKPGMKVNVSPSTVKKEEYGYVLGIVTEVSEFPSTAEGMMKVLQNQQLVDRLSGRGAPIAVRADLIESPDTPSGYQWSSSMGPDDKIHAGTLCGSMVITREQRPIGLVVPLVKKMTGL